MPRSRCRIAVVNLALLFAGCNGPKVVAPLPTPAPTPIAHAPADAETIRAADVRILFVGNSHTSIHDMPGLVAAMIRDRRPAATVATHTIPVAYLEDAARDPSCRDEIESQAWTHVVLQAQKISMSGRHNYPREGGIDLAKRAKARGAAVVFYPEWGLQGKPGDGERQEAVYREMAEAAGVGVAPVAKAWDLALAGRPDLPLYGPDGNHQSPVGAFLTACVLTSRLTGESPAGLATFAYPAAAEADRRYLADVAVKALAEK